MESSHAESYAASVKKSMEATLAAAVSGVFADGTELSVTR